MVSPGWQPAERVAPDFQGVFHIGRFNTGLAGNFPRNAYVLRHERKLKSGGERARAVAMQTMERVRATVGLR